MTQNVFTILLKPRNMPTDYLVVIGHFFFGPGLEKTWCRTCTEKSNREWDRTAGSMILQLVTESCHPVFRASSAFERGELDIREYGKKSTRLSDNDRNVEWFLRAIKSVNQL